MSLAQSKPHTYRVIELLAECVVERLPARLIFDALALSLQGRFSVKSSRRVTFEILQHVPPAERTLFTPDLPCCVSFFRDGRCYFFVSRVAANPGKGKRMTLALLPPCALAFVEQRHAVRIPVLASAGLFAEIETSRGDLIRALPIDISEGGIQLEPICALDLELGTEVTVRLRLDEERADLRAKVHYHRGSRYGFSFVPPTSATHRALRAMVQIAEEHWLVSLGQAAAPPDRRR